MQTLPANWEKAVPVQFVKSNRTSVNNYRPEEGLKSSVFGNITLFSLLKINLVM
jgi:hypothetical protein